MPPITARVCEEDSVRVVQGSESFSRAPIYEPRGFVPVSRQYLVLGSENSRLGIVFLSQRWRARLSTFDVKHLAIFASHTHEHMVAVHIAVTERLVGKLPHPCLPRTGPQQHGNPQAVREVRRTGPRFVELKGLNEGRQRFQKITIAQRAGAQCNFASDLA